jgi:Fic family protein
MPVSIELLKEIHKILTEGARGKDKAPGEFRKTQNWIGPLGGSLIDAIFIPPPPENVLPAMQDLEKFILKDEPMPQLLKIALIHAQFETIHPFRDGNGRVGRLLITLYLLWKKILSRPLLYLSFYLKKNREQYYDQLMKTRTDGNWENWITFFLEGIKVTSKEAILTAKNIINLKDSLIEKIYQKSISSIHAVKLIDLLFERPVIAVNDVIERIKISKDTATELVNKFEKAQILKEITGKKRYRRYMFKDYVDLIARGTEIE